MTDPKLIALGKRINAAMDRIEEERDGLRDIYLEAKSAGYIPKMLRKAISRQRMDASKRQEEDSILDLYDHALGNVGKALRAIAEGATWDEVSKAHDVPRATMARAAAVSKRREVIPVTKAETACVDGSACLDVRCDLNGCRRVEPPHDAETGEVIEDAAPQGTYGPETESLTQPGGDERVSSAGTHSDTALLAEAPGSGEVRAVNEAASGQPAADSSCSPVRKASDSTEPVVPTGNEGRAGERDPIEDDLTLPAFLDRRRAAA